MNDKFAKVHGNIQENFSSEAVCEWAESVDKRLEALEQAKPASVTSMSAAELASILIDCSSVLTGLIYGKKFELKEVENLIHNVNRAICCINDKS